MPSSGASTAPATPRLDLAPEPTLVRSFPLAGCVGLALVLGPLIVRATTPALSLPGWELDPTLMDAPSVGVVPSLSMLLDAIVLVGVGVLLGARVLTRNREPRGLGRVRVEASVVALIVALATLPLVSIIWHAWPWPGTGPLEGATIEQRRIGAAWASAAFAGVGLWSIGHDPRLRRVALATLLGFVVLMAFKGAWQYFVEHAQTLAHYRANREALLAANGWAPDSSAALAYDRRISQPELTAWLALSNVFGSFIGAGFASAAVLAASAWMIRARSRATPDHAHHRSVAALTIVSLGALLLGAALLASRSRGAMVATLAGVAGIALLALLTRVRNRAIARPNAPSTRRALDTLWRLRGAVGVAMIVGTLAIVAARGLVGERLSELSLLFRAWYAEAALRIFAHNPVVGVGPDGFKGAYLIFKNPLNPEEVQSPHSVLLDWLACLGALGLAWWALLLWGAWRSARGAVLDSNAPDDADPAPSLVANTPDALSPDASRPIDPERALLRVAFLIPASATIATFAIETPLITPENAAIRLLGLLAWCAGAWAMLATTRRAPGALRLALAGGAFVLLAHAQIEVNVSWVQSSGLVLAWIGLAAGACSPRSTAGPITEHAPATATPAPARPTDRAATILAMSAACVPIALGVALVVVGTLPARSWERRLAEAGAIVAPLGRLETNLRSLSTPGLASDEAARIRTEVLATLREALGREIEPTSAGVSRAAGEARVALSTSAAERLLRDDNAPVGTDWEARALAVRLLRSASLSSSALGRTDDALRLNDRARQAGTPTQPARAPSLPELVTLASVNEDRAGLSGDLVWLRRADELLAKAVTLDPFALSHWRRRLSIAQKLGDDAGARAAAARLLELDEFVRLDRAVKGLPPSERERVERLARP